MEQQSQYMLRVASKNCSPISGIIFGLRQKSQAKSEDLGKLLAFLFPEKESEASLYELGSTEKFSADHAIGLLASIYGRNEYTADNVSKCVTQWRKKFNSPCDADQMLSVVSGPCLELKGPIFTFIFSSRDLADIGEIAKTPDGNKDFRLADDKHYDLRGISRDKLLQLLTDLANQNSLIFYRLTDHALFSQVTIVLLAHGSGKTQFGLASSNGSRTLSSRDEVVLRMMIKECNPTWHLFMSLFPDEQA